ncbi:uncharacterized protein LOC134006304 [Scomber scombrus]|uniref:uncharacterized protein LOC134006304 n=1 Tax=Scomber scombrus TaxID=13677 RepID=UPI002DD9F495|nr:uncharacterized protein LOC134006304 [Scomber scombrus]
MNKENLNNLQADFYKDGVLMQSSPVAEMTINNVSKSNEGLYRCNISGVGTSPDSWLAVGALERNNPVLHRSSIPILWWIALTILLVSMVLLVVGFLYTGRHRDAVHRVVLYFSSKTQRSAARSAEDNNIDSGDDTADDQSSPTYAVVVKKQRQSKESRSSSSNVTWNPTDPRLTEQEVYSFIKTATATARPTASPAKPQAKAIGIQEETSKLDWPDLAGPLSKEEATSKSEKEKKLFNRFWQD